MPVSNFVSWLKVRALKIELCFLIANIELFCLAFNKSSA